MRVNVPSPRVILEQPEIVVNALNELFAAFETLRRDFSEMKQEMDAAARRAMTHEQEIVRTEERLRKVEAELKGLLRGSSGGGSPRPPPPRGRRLGRR